MPRSVNTGKGSIAVACKLYYKTEPPRTHCIIQRTPQGGPHHLVLYSKSLTSQSLSFFCPFPSLPHITGTHIPKPIDWWTPHHPHFPNPHSFSMIINCRGPPSRECDVALSSLFINWQKKKKIHWIFYFIHFSFIIY